MLGYDNINLKSETLQTNILKSNHAFTNPGSRSPD